jgi:Pyruvate/2-oxoacid:ferredoxin oxidoreductase delta subunit
VASKLPLRSIIEIDEEKCDGCGRCIPRCAENALRIVDGKARLMKDVYCDGLGACLDHCPRGAITIVRREAEPFNEEAARAFEAKGSRIAKAADEDRPSGSFSRASALRNWPVQIRLVSSKALFFRGADLLVVADCVPFAYADLHADLLPGKAVLVGCPKFDDVEAYVEKITEILRLNDVRSVTVVNMDVPCCGGLRWIVDHALESSGKSIAVERRVLNVKGEMV